METTEKAKYAAPAASKLMDIVDLMARANRGFSINELAKNLKAPVNSLYRICRQMQERGYLDRNQEDGLYYLGTRLYVIGQIAGNRIALRTQALPLMQALRDALGETVHLTLLREDRMVLLDQAETDQPIRIHVETGSLLLPHASAFGKCLLAYLDDGNLENYLKNDLVALTPATITDKSRFRHELGDIRQNGWSYDLEEYMLGVRCVGAPIFDLSGTCIAAVGIIAPAYRFAEASMEKARCQVMDTARAISRTLGYDEVRHGS
jgi:DNA-binding IclR family transcriptional regulator